MRRVAKVVVVLVAVAGVLAAGGAAGAAGGVVKVYEAGDGGWHFNRDPNSSTPYEMTTDRASIGAGSLHVLPITNLNDDATLPQPGDKFVAELPLGIPSAALTSVAYDVLIDRPAGTVPRTGDTYVNVYANLPGSSTFYDCRYDYVAPPGSTTEFTTVAFAAARPSGGISRGACAATPGGLPEGSTISFLALNVGDSRGGDTGLGAYLDNVVVTTTAGSTTYDFDVRTTLTKDDCWDGGWRDAGFQNQGRCVSSLRPASKVVRFA